MDFEALWQGYQGDASAATALDYLQQQGWIELESKQMTEVYRVLSQQIDTATLAEELHGLFEKKEQSELARLQALLAFFTSTTCLSHELARYFADDAPPSGAGTVPSAGRDRRVAAACITGLAQRARLRAWCDPLIALCHQRHPRILTRFLCGIATPLTTRLKARIWPVLASWRTIPSPRCWRRCQPSIPPDPELAGLAPFRR
jgi:ATP-dependent DNA helicase RecQ